MYAKTRAATDAAVEERAKYAKYANNGRAMRGHGTAPEVLRKPTDCRDDPKYQGQTSFMIKFIPNKCIDERTEVDEVALREWVLCAVVEEDPYSRRFFVEIHRIQANIAEIDGHLCQIPKLEFLDEDGKPMTDDKARIERETIFNKYSEDRGVAEEQLIVAKQQLQNHIDWRRKMGVKFTRGELDRNTDTVTWYMNLSGANDADEMEDLLILKMNWPGIKLACGNPRADPPFLPWAGRGDIPDGSKPNMPDYTNLQVAIAGARFCRVPSGIGLLQSLNRTSVSIYGEEFGLFYGEFEAGLRHGYGININDEGVHAGSYEKGFRRGHGRLDYADGTTVIGYFGPDPQRKLLETAQFHNPYREGEANGLVEINFGDGGFYRGHMLNGRITGQGDYQSAFNEVLSGTFHDGALHCERGFQQNAAEDVYIGTFRHGELHGKGTHMSKIGDSYDGHWEHFLRHGRGVSRTGTTGEYRGYHINNLKHGKGSLAYGNAASKAAAKKSRQDERRQREEEEALRTEAETHQKAGTTKSDGSAGDPSCRTKCKTAANTKDNSIKVPAASVHGEKSKEQSAETVESLAPRSAYDNIFQGYFLGSAISNAGCVMNTQVQVPSILSRLNKRSCYPISRELNRELRHAKARSRLQEKLCDMEGHVREEICAKKVKIYKQQKHYTKKTMYVEETAGGIEFEELRSKLFLRQERLKNMTEDKHLFKKAVVPRLRMLNTRPYDAMTKTYERLRPEAGSELREVDQVNDQLVRIALSDFEEVQERQRFLKYDLIWQRAENAFAAAHGGTTVDTDL